MNTEAAGRAALYGGGALFIALPAAAIYVYASFAARFAFLGPPTPPGAGVVLFVYAVAPAFIGAASLLVARGLEATWNRSLAISGVVFVSVPLLGLATAGADGVSSRPLFVAATVAVPALVALAACDRRAVAAPAVILSAAFFAVPLSAFSSYTGLFAGLAVGLCAWVIPPAVAGLSQPRKDEEGINSGKEGAAGAKADG